jgi:serine/threonine-protein kinase
MGRVYRAHDPVLGRDVALKTIKEPFVRDARAMMRFRREAEVFGRLSHPGLVSVYDVGEDHIVLELVEGESLAVRLARKGPLCPAAALPIFAAIADVLDHVHARGIIHRDVKPPNVMVLPRGGVKLTDFGIARLAWAPVTATGELIGSPAYMAPEQIAVGEAEPASDVYALGVVAYEVLTGQLPIDASNLGALLVRITTESPPPARSRNPALPVGADAVLARVLAKRPRDRYPTARAFVAALQAACA